MGACWRDIFHFAAADSDGLKQGWLLQVATLCRALSEFAIDALYENPKIVSDKKMQKLLATLDLPNTFFYYRAKIHSLHLGPQFTPKISALEPLIRRLPQLKHFSTSHEFEQPRYCGLVRSGPKIEPSFWAILDERKHLRPGMAKFPAHLLSWKWIGNLLPDFLSGSRDILRLQTVGPLRGVQKLHLSNFPPVRYNGERSPVWDAVSAQILPTMLGHLSLDDNDAPISTHVVLWRIIEIINSLKHMEHLILEGCWDIQGWFWFMLPNRLKHLEVTYCGWDVGQGLPDFLNTSGHNLTTLILNHNPALDLYFLENLRRNCPNLEKLVVNMALHRDPITASTEPDFDPALDESSVPAWPSSLRHIELLNIRPWKPEAATMLFESLINSASELPNLRYLVIKSMLDIDWRRRAAVRRIWFDRLVEVFLRPPSKDPAPTLPLKPVPKAILDTDAKEGSRGKQKPPTGPSTRRSGRIHTQRSAEPRGSRSGGARYAEPPSDPEDDADSEPSASDSDSETEVPGAQGSRSQRQSTDHAKPFVQGLCERVELTIENHTLAEVQYGMGDFMDASAESESDDSDFAG